MGFEADDFGVFADGGAQAEVGDAAELLPAVFAADFVDAVGRQGGDGRQGDVGGGEAKAAGELLPVLDAAADGEGVAEHAADALEVSFGEALADAARADDVSFLAKEFVDAGGEAEFGGGATQEFGVAAAAFPEVPVGADGDAGDGAGGGEFSQEGSGFGVGEFAREGQQQEQVGAEGGDALGFEGGVGGEEFGGGSGVEEGEGVLLEGEDAAQGAGARCAADDGGMPPVDAVEEAHGPVDGAV